MKKNILSILILISVLLLTGTSQAKPMVIAHPDVGVSEMESSRLKNIYLNRSKKWSNGHRIHLTIHSDQPSTIVFIRDYLGKTSAQFNRYWKRQLFSGKGIPPKYFHSREELIQYVKNTKGAIGFIDSETPPAGVILITIIDE